MVIILFKRQAILRLLFPFFRRNEEGTPRKLTQFWHWYAAGSLQNILLPVQEVLSEMSSAFTAAASFICQCSWRLY